MAKLQNQVALITGAGQGMGRATAELFAREGAKVVAVDINEAAAGATIAGLAGADHSAHACDVADSAAVTALFAAVAARYGRIDVLVNNAGVGSAPGDGFDLYQQRLAERGAQLARGETPTVFADHLPDLGDAGWQRVLDINLNGTFYCTREAVRLMIKAGARGSIVSIASTSALTGEGPPHYCASKAAMLGLTKCLARELGPRGIRINAICPGPTNTPMMQAISEEWAQAMVAGLPLGRMGEPEEVAKAVLFLASEDGSLFTGQTLGANAGMYML